jgi:hypothetical protein
LSVGPHPWLLFARWGFFMQKHPAMRMVRDEGCRDIQNQH